MSRNITALTPTQSIAPLIDITEGKSFVVHKGAKTIRYFVLPATSGGNFSGGNNGTTTFNVFLPSKETILDRNIYLRAKVTHYAKSANTDDTTGLFVDNKDAPRPFPITSLIKTATIDFDNNGVQLNVNKVHKHLANYYYDQEDLISSSSSTPSLLDNQFYYYGGGNNNVLAFNKDTSYDSVPPRGAFGVLSMVNSHNGTNKISSLTQSYLETLPISPLLLKNDMNDEEGLTNISNIKISLTFESGQTSFIKAFSHDILTITTNTINGTTLNPETLRFINTTNNANNRVLQEYYTNIDSIELIIGMVTVQDTMIVPPIVNYEYTQISYTETSDTAEVPPYLLLSTNTKTTIQSNNIQLSQIPHWVQMQAHLPESLTYDIGAEASAAGDVTTFAAAPLPAYSLPDSYFPILGIDMTVGNQSGILATASQQQLFNMNIKNGLSFRTFTESGLGSSVMLLTYGVNGSGTYERPIGAPLRLRFGEDIPLNDPLMAPGLSMNLNFQVDLKVINNFKVAKKPVITLIFGYEGVATFDRARGVFFNTSVLTKEDVLDTTKEVDWSDVQPSSYGGSFLGKLKKLAKRTGRTISHVAQAAPGYVQKGIELAEKAAPYAERAAEIAAMSGLGYGNGGCCGNALVGGRTLSRKQMQKRLAY